MPNGGETTDVKAFLEATGNLAGPGDVLHGIAGAAKETFGLLDYASQQRAATALTVHLEVMLGLWQRECQAMVRH